MVLPSLFAKKSKPDKDRAAAPAPLNSHNLAPSSSHTPTGGSSRSNPGTPPSSPEKKSYDRLRDRERSSRRSNSYSLRRSSKYDRDSHPLNLPPDELKRLSSQMSAQNQQQQSSGLEPMDVDPPSPAPKMNGNGGETEGRPAPPPHRYTTSPPPQTATYAATPEAASTPVQPPTIDAEEYKAAGNKFFKIKDYAQAIKEYSKGA